MKKETERKIKRGGEQSTNNHSQCMKINQARAKIEAGKEMSERQKGVVVLIELKTTKSYVNIVN